jgi:hypothetical protein
MPSDVTSRTSTMLSPHAAVDAFLGDERTRSCPCRLGDGISHGCRCRGSGMATSPCADGMDGMCEGITRREDAPPRGSGGARPLPGEPATAMLVQHRAVSNVAASPKRRVYGSLSRSNIQPVSDRLRRELPNADWFDALML